MKTQRLISDKQTNKYVVQSVDFNCLNKAADIDFFRSLFDKHIQENTVYKEPFLVKGKWNAKGINFWTFFWVCYAWNKNNMDNVIFFLILPNAIVWKYNNFNIGTVNATQ